MLGVNNSSSNAAAASLLLPAWYQSHRSHTNGGLELPESQPYCNRYF